MADTDGFRTSEKMASLVLSIFKGENFVVKDLRTPCRVYLRAKCADLQPELALESGTVELTSALTEPEFNSQLAWSLTRKQLKELRSNRSTIKVTCFIADRMGTETEVGYVVIHVKDATAFVSGFDVDPTKASTFPLLGTKDHWRTLQPKIQMVLHLEEVTPEKRTQGIMKPTVSKAQPHGLPPLSEVNKTSRKQEEAEIEIKNAAKLSETKLLPYTDTTKFKWTVREKDGYFQLGDPSDEDDLYILNTTVISASYLHSLWDGRSPRKRGSVNYFWQVRYEAYGCEISSEPFVLADNDESRRTFIGDKATARIRTNGALFFQYLQETNIQFQIIRYQVGSNKDLVNPEVMGIGFASLSELTDPNKREHRVCMEILSEWGTPRVPSMHEKPEVRVLFYLEAIPNYLKFCNKGTETNNNDVATSDMQNNNTNSPPHNEASPRIRLDSAGVRGALDAENEDMLDGAGTAGDTDFEAVSNTSNARRLLQFEDQAKQSGSPPSISSPLTSPEKRTANVNLRTQHRTQALCSNGSESDDNTDNSSNKENLAKIMPPPGDYQITIGLTRFWLKSKRIIQDNFTLSYTHPPIGILDKPIECYAEPADPSYTEANRHGFLINEGEYTTAVSIAKYSERLLNEPLTVGFHRTTSEAKSKCFASAMIPFGRIFLQKGRDNCWIMEDAADVLKIGQNVRIGSLFFKIKLVLKSSPPAPTERNANSQRHSSFFPPSTSKANTPPQSTEGYTRDPDRMEKVTEDMREWRRKQEEMYKRQKEQTETAYLKILSEEAAKRDAERESVMAKKLAEIDKKDKELNRQRKVIEEKEEKLKQFDIELQDKARKLAIEQESFQQHSTLAHQRLEEAHKIEVEGFKRRIKGFQDELKELKAKIVLLEKKLETKEAEIDNLTALKRELPDVRLEQRVSLLEQENKSLKNQLRDASARKEQYKKQSFALCQKLSRIQLERDQELKDQNENLRLQILASKEHKELKKERKAVQDLSQTLKALQKETVHPPESNDVRGENGYAPNGAIRKSNVKLKSDNTAEQKSKEDEVRRLVAERNKLLQTGAYNKFDSVIREFEKRMVAIAQEQ